MVNSEKEEQKVLVKAETVSVVVELEDGKKTFVFDPKKLKMIQFENVQRVLIDSGYYDALAKFEDPQLLGNMQKCLMYLNDVTEPGKKKLLDLQVNYDESDTSAIAQEARWFKTTLLNGTRLSTRKYRELNKCLVQTKSIGKLLSHLLVEEGKKYNSDDATKFTENIFPELGIEESENVLRGFFSSENLLKIASPSYLQMTFNPQTPEETEKQNETQENLESLNNLQSTETESKQPKRQKLAS